MILSIAVIFLISVNFAFAVDENTTDLASDSFDNELNIVDIESQNVLSDNDSSGDLLAVEDDVQENQSSIDTGKITKRYNVGVEYSATFYDSNHNPLANTIVECGVDSPFYGVNTTTDSKGIALFLLPLEKGNHKLYLINPDTFEVATDNVKVFDVLTDGKNLNVYFNSGKSYSVRVYGDDGKHVSAGKKVTFTINYGKVNSKTNKMSVVSKKYTVKTDKKGFAKLKINLKPGTYTVMAQYKNFFTLNKIIVKPTIIHLTHFGSKALKKTFKFKVKLLKSTGKVFKNKKIKIKFNKKTYYAKTNKKGIATFTLKTPLKTGKFNIVSTYGKATATSQLIRYRV